MDVFHAMKVFLTVAEHGGFSAASKQLNISVPSVTRIVAQLEEHLGTRLLQRTTRRVSLTAAGEQYAKDAQRIVESVELAHAAVQDSTALHSGTLRIGCLPSFAEHWIAPLYADFQSAYPDISLDVYVEAHPLANLAYYDVAMLSVREGADFNIIARNLFAYDAILCASPEYLSQHGTPTQPEHLVQHNCLLRRATGMHDTQIQLWKQGQNMRLPPMFQGKVKSNITINHTGSLLRIALDGAGIAAFSYDIVASYLAQGRLVHLLPEWITGRFNVLAALPSHRHLPARTQVFLDFLTAHGRGIRTNLPSG